MTTAPQTMLTRVLGAPLKISSPSANAVSKKLTDQMSGFWLFKVHWLLIEFLCQLTDESLQWSLRRRRLWASPAH